MLFYFTLWESSHQSERVVRARGTQLRQGAACYASLCRAPDFHLKAEDRSPSILPTAFQSLASETGISSTSHSFLYFWSIFLRAFGCVKSNRLACTCVWSKWPCWTKSSAQWGLPHISSAKVMRWHEVSKSVTIPRPAMALGNPSFQLSHRLLEDRELMEKTNLSLFSYFCVSIFSNSSSKCLMNPFGLIIRRKKGKEKRTMRKQNPTSAPCKHQYFPRVRSPGERGHLHRGRGSCFSESVTGF